MHLVLRLKVLCPSLGKLRIAQDLARAGLHLGATTVGRMLKSPPPADEREQALLIDEQPAESRRVTAKYPDHVWHVDLSVVPSAAGFWVPWLPFSKRQRWPHQALDGETLAEVHAGGAGTRKSIAFEPRSRWPVVNDDKVARVRGLRLIVTHFEGREHLRIVALAPAA